jgi:hypothetical protein
MTLQTRNKEPDQLYFPSMLGSDFSFATGGAVVRCEKNMIWLGESYRDEHEFVEFRASLSREQWFEAGLLTYRNGMPEVPSIHVLLNEWVRTKLVCAFAHVNSRLHATAPVAEALLSRAVPLRERLSLVKATLGLSTKDLAEILHCSRAIIYVWLKPEHDGQANVEALQRLSSLEQLVKVWSTHGVGSLGGHLHGMALEAEGGRSLYELLKESPIDITRCGAALDAIAKECQVHIAATRRVDELVARGFGH